jgi:hypothetical protein
MKGAPAVAILFYIAKHKCDFPNLKRLSPAQVLAQLSEQDARYRLEEKGL